MIWPAKYRLAAVVKARSYLGSKRHRYNVVAQNSFV
jgi:hypothetical protein